MITIFSGLPRSGKSYRGVHYIYNNFMNVKSDSFLKHRYLYTNIGGFKHDFVNEILFEQNIIVTDQMKIDFPHLDFGAKCYPKNDPKINNEIFIKESIYLDWDVFYDHLLTLYDMALQDKPDEELLCYLTYHKLSPALFVIDEAYRYYDKKVDPALKWWHGYHGHLGHDIILIIHRPQLMTKDYYSGYVEDFIDAQPKSKAFFNNRFRYYFYADDSYNIRSKHHSDALTAKMDIFKLYKSGDLHNPRKILYKWIGLLVIAFLFAVGVFIFFMNSLSNRAKSNNAKSSSVHSQSQSVSSTNIKDINETLENFVILTVRCFDNSCARIDPQFQTRYIDRHLFEDVFKRFSFVPVSSRQLFINNISVTEVTHLVPKNSLSLFPYWNIPIVAQKQSLDSVSVNPLSPKVNNVSAY
jgi:zona occludens toxin